MSIVTDAVLSIRSEFKASVADALEASASVDTTSVTTHHSVHDALVNICGGEGSLTVSQVRYQSVSVLDTLWCCYKQSQSMGQCTQSVHPIQLLS